ncbi:MAG TPA: lanthionine synthetase C family protein [Thermoanaerobaculia bacterium]|nr:lanthionine synthetase C family protein [Thermoanaerobaculia bacterium]
MKKPASWRPLLDGDLAARARDAVSAIAGALPVVSPPEIDNAWAREARVATLSSGNPGMALLFGYLARNGGPESERYVELTENFLDDAVEALSRVPMTASLYSGYLSVAWAAEHLDRLLGAEEDPGEDPNEEIDLELLGILAQSPWTGHYDLISGLVGFGVYALERLPRPTVVQCLEAVVDRLDEMAVEAREGVTWHTRQGLLPPYMREPMPQGFYNLGVAHGVPGVIALLGDVCRAGVRVEKARPLLDGAVRWLLAQRRPDDGGSCFATWLSPGVEPRPSRLAWCYGDPGIAAALLSAARAVGEESWEHEALAIATHSVRMPPEASGVVDAGLCHGAIGLGHLYNRLHQATGEEAFAEAARFWFGQGLDMRRPGQGVAGFTAWDAATGETAHWMDEPGFLTGAAGIGLALLAAISDVEPKWDRVLLVSVPPGREPASSPPGDPV